MYGVALGAGAARRAPENWNDGLVESGGRAVEQTANTVAEILERTAEFYSSVLWDSETGNSVRTRLERAEIDPGTLRRFGVGYAPVDPREYLDQLGSWRYSAPDLLEAGVVTRSGRRHIHARFHSRIMFPVRDRAGALRGFAGLATHLGPSWPLWLTSPERGPFERGAALFGIDQAAAAIADAGHAKVLNDCLEVLRLQAVGEKNAVATCQSPLTAEHLRMIAAEISVSPDELRALRLAGGKGAKSITLVGLDGELQDEVPELRSARAAPVPAKPAEMIVSENRNPEPAPAEWDQAEPPTPWQRVVRVLAAGLVGVGLPLLWLALIKPGNEAGGDRGVAFGLVALGVGASFGVLALVAARVSARARARSAERRMRAPYLHGSTEWQPPAWTYHRIEDLLIGAAVVSMVILFALFMTIGGYTGWNTD